MSEPIPCTPDCAERTATCHGTCPRYARWRAAKDKENEAMKKIKKAEWDYYDHRTEYAAKCAKKRGAMK